MIHSYRYRITLISQGTAVGDPIEAQALASVFASGRTSENPLYLGSLKSQIGHLEGASGIASIVKTVLALERGMILPNANFEVPNTELSFDQWNFKVSGGDYHDAQLTVLQVATKKQPWLVSNGQVRTASVNGFGFGGTNVHVILSEPAMQPPKVLTNGVNSIESVNGHDESVKSVPYRLYVMSAKSDTSLVKHCGKLATYLENCENISKSGVEESLAYTLGMRRSRFQWRYAVTANSTEDLIENLQEVKAKLVRTTYAPITAFIFTGQGAQWFGMGRELFFTYPVFAASMRKANEYLKEMEASWSLIGECWSLEPYSEY